MNLKYAIKIRTEIYYQLHAYFMCKFLGISANHQKQIYKFKYMYQYQSENNSVNGIFAC